MNPQDDYLPALLQSLAGADPEQTALRLAQAANDHPNDARPLLLLGAELAQAGKIDGAEAAYTVAIQRVPEFWIARFQLGLLQFTSARPAIARVTWAPLDSLAEGHPLRLFKLGFESLAEDRFDDTARLLRQGMAANTDNPPLNRDMQMLLDKLAAQGLLSADAAAAAATPEPAADAAPAEHFLVSAYRNVH